MQFTSREIKMIERLRKQQQQWPISRLIVLCSGLLFSGLCAWVLSAEIQHYREGLKLREVLWSELEKLPSEQLAQHFLKILPTWQDQIVEVALFVPIWFVFALLALSHLLIVVIYWRGRANDILLLRIIDAEQSKKATETNT